MRKVWIVCVMVLVALGTVAVGVSASRRMDSDSASAAPTAPKEHALNTITFNTGAYGVTRRKLGIDKRTLSITAEEDMHIVALTHFIGVNGGSFGDNGHILSTSPDNPWVKWEETRTGMEPTGTKGYFGYCGRDYYAECNGIADIMAWQTFPAGTYILVRKGETLYMHCYACLSSKSAAERGEAHHKVEVYYW